MGRHARRRAAPPAPSQETRNTAAALLAGEMVLAAVSATVNAAPGAPSAAEGYQELLSAAIARGLLAETIAALATFAAGAVVDIYGVTGEGPVDVLNRLAGFHTVI